MIGTARKFLTGESRSATASAAGRLARLERILDSAAERETRLLRELARLRRAHVAAQLASLATRGPSAGPAAAPGD